ncbi:MAG: GldG family protein [Dehalococcoidales bacterium]|nr:GldG family protein [Dehalococcoidales bacterium]
MKTLLHRISLPAAYVGVGALLGSVVYYIIYGNLGPIVMGLALAGVVILAVAIWGSGADVAGALTGRSARRGSNSAVMMLAFVGIVGLVNFTAAHHTYRWDLTETEAYSLSPQTLSILSNLQTPIKVVGIYLSDNSGSQQARQQAEDLLKEYAARSDKFTYEFVDPDRQPTVVQQYHVTSEGLIFLSGDKRQDVTGISESDFTNALIKITSNKQLKVAFVLGHGERSVDPNSQASGQGSYMSAKAALEADNYEVTTLSLVSGPVPADIAALIIADPKTPLLDQERQTLRDYLQAGGKAMVMYEPGEDTDLGQILSDYGLQLGKDYVVDPGRALMYDAGTPIITKYGWSPITKDLPQTVFPTVAAITPPASATDGTAVTPLARTSDQSWGETDVQNPKYDDGVDAKGPLDIAVSVEADAKTTDSSTSRDTQGSPPKTRLVVVGDADFAADGIIQMAGNRDFFVNSVNWLTESENLISIRPKPPEVHTVYLTSQQANLIGLSSVVLLPLLVLVWGSSIWWSRR